MLRLGSIVPLVLVFAPSVLGGCKKDEPVTQPETATSALGVTSAKARMPLRNAMAPVPKIEPQAMKDYRLEVCYFGTLTLRQARDAYLASLGKDEPSEKKIPNFGMPPALPPASMIPPPVTAPGAGSAGPTPSGSARAAAPVAVPAPSGSVNMGRRMADMGLRAPHERNARACTVAAGLKEPAMPDVDAALKDFAPFALELSRNIAAASVYYQREEFTKDKFEKGKELHKKLVADFAKLDELSDKLAVAINAHREKNPVDVTKLEEGEKAVFQAYTDARAIVGLLLTKKIDPAAYKTAIANIEKSIEAVKAVSAKNTNDVWTKITVPSLDAFLKGARDAEAKITDKGLPSDTFLQLINTFTAVIEGKHRALSRSLIAKGQTVEPRGAPGLNGRGPMPGAHPELQKDPHGQTPEQH